MRNGGAGSHSGWKLEKEKEGKMRMEYENFKD